MQASSSRKARRSATAGFSLVEILVAIVGLAIILVAAGQLVFATRRSTQREQYQVEARQTARAAGEYANYLLRGATDFNYFNGNAGAIVVWIWQGTGGGGKGGAQNTCPGSAGCLQATYDNLTAAQAGAGLGDQGTDLITFGRPSNPQFVSPTFWPGYQHASNVNWEVPSPPCPTDNTTALNAFCNMVDMPGCSGMSPELLLVDSSGNWAFYQITNVVGCEGNNCCANGVHVTSNAGLSTGINPPGGHPDLNNPQLVAGAQFAALRVCNGWFEQKSDIFDPATDNNCPVTPPADGSWAAKPGWTPLLPNVEDFQIAYLFKDGSTWNNVVNGPTFTCNGIASNVPCAAGTCDTPPCAVSNTDISNVIGFRITITARSSQQMSLESPLFLRPSAEDNPGAATPDAFYHFQGSSVAMIRNRTGGY